MRLIPPVVDCGATRGSNIRSELRYLLSRGVNNFGGAAFIVTKFCVAQEDCRIFT